MKNNIIKTFAFIISILTFISPFCKPNNVFANTDNEIVIVTQPSDSICNTGDRASFSITAEGLGLTYNWQLSSDNGSSWTDSTAKGHNTSSISLPVIDYSYKLIYRCVVTDKLGNSIISDTCKVEKKQEHVPLQITSQPSDSICNTGDRASFSITAEGLGLTYNWQLSSDNGSSWTDSTAKGHNTSSVSLPVIDYSYKLIYRCVVTDRLGNSIISDIVKITKPQLKNFTLTNTDYDPEFCTIDDELLIDVDEFIKNCKLISESNERKSSVIYNCNLNVNYTDLLILKLTVQAQDKCAKINICVNNEDITATYPVYTQKADYYIPITNISTIKSIYVKLETNYQKVIISDFQLVNFNNSNINNHKIGIYPQNTNKTIISENEAFGVSSNASTADNNYLYSVNNGILTVYDIRNGKSPEIISTLSGLGKCHDISLLNNNKALVITSRENGAYFVDVSDPKKPTIASSYSTLEMATGLAVCGEYVFMCSRYFGTEIVYAGDIYNPKYYSQVSNLEEMYDCSVYNNYLYIGIWGQKKVQIYDISDLRNPKLANTIMLDGNAGGIVVDNGILYASTGYHSRDDSTSVSSVGFGMGNGMEIYDISDPKNPVWLSTSKIDGRYKYSGNDYWKIKVSNNYAFLASTYNGLYIYDVSDPSNPELVNNLTVRIEKDSANYKAYLSGSYIFNFDTSKYNQAAILSICTSSDRVFFGDPLTGIYETQFEGVASEKISNDSLSGSNKKQVSLPEINGYSSYIYESDCSIYKAKYANGLIYLATSKGIQVIDKALNLLNEYNTQYSVKDLAVSSDGKYLYTAECEAGVGVYSIDGSNVFKISFCKNCAKPDFTVTSIALSADESALIAQAGFSRVATINISNKLNPVMTVSASYGTMYYRNICPNIINNKYNALIDGKKITLYSVSNGIISKDIVINNSVSSESNGMAACGKYMVSIYKNGYIYFDPTSQTESLSSLTVNKIPGILLKGKPAVYGNIMVVSYCINGEFFIIDISDLDNPKLIGNSKISGSLDVATITDDFILIPLRNDGLLMLENNAI